MAFERALLFLMFASALTVVRAADGTDATCNSTTGYDWTENSLQQSPCYVAAQLGGICKSDDFFIRKLSPGYYYAAPYAEDPTIKCKCSTVYYSMLSSCAVCQGNTRLTWSDWAVNCTTVYSKKLPGNIPPNVNVPGWAYLDVIADNRWNATRSHDYWQSNPAAESKGVTQSTVTEVPSSTGGSSSSSATLPSQSQDGNTDPASGDDKYIEGGKLNTGAIIGGVVGGVLGIAIIWFLIWFFRLRKNTTKYAATTQIESPQMANSHQLSAAGSNPHGSSTPQKLYDPADPTTFPNYRGSYHSDPMAVDHRNSYANPALQGSPRTAYTGAAEV